MVRNTQNTPTYTHIIFVVPCLSIFASLQIDMYILLSDVE